MPVYEIDIETKARSCRLALELREECRSEKKILAYLRGGRTYEPDVSRVLLNILAEGDVVLDVGANIGFFTVLMASLVGASGRVLSFEPGQANLSRLRANVALGGFANVQVIDRPASNRVEETTFYVNSDDNGGNALWDPALFPGNTLSRQEPIWQRMTATTIDEEIARHAVAPPKLIKIDTEGAEHLILQGACSMLDTHKVPFVLAEVHEFGLASLGSSQEGLRGFMESRGYSTFLVYNSGSLPKFVPPGTMVKSLYIFNVLFAAPESLAPYWPVEYFNANDDIQPLF